MPTHAPKEFTFTHNLVEKIPNPTPTPAHNKTLPPQPHPTRFRHTPEEDLFDYLGTDYELIDEDQSRALQFGWFSVVLWVLLGVVVGGVGVWWLWYV